MTEVKNIIEECSIDVYDASEGVGEALLQSGALRVTVHQRKSANAGSQGALTTLAYHSLIEASESVADVCILDNDAIKVLVAMYPSAPKYVLVRFAPRVSWILGFFGLLRRVLVGLVRIRGVIVFNGEGKNKTRWLILEQSGKAAPYIPVLPKTIGIQQFITWLNKEKVSYVVLRFYEQLPVLHREAGDLDILVSDLDAKRVEEFLKSTQKHTTSTSEDIRVGLHSISGAHGSVPYYPPQLARNILERSIAGPAQAKIPAQKDFLLSFMYHCLYHAKKGYTSGIPSRLKKYTDAHPENDYYGVIQEKAKALGVNVGTTMEDMDEFLAAEGWRPKLDTLAKIAETNAWVHDRFFAGIQERTPAAGLSVFVVREWAVKEGLSEKIVALIKKEGYSIVRSKMLSLEEKQFAFERLRGGTWGSDENGNTDDWKPAFAIIVLDTQCARMPHSYAAGFERFRIRNLKEVLRKQFDTPSRGAVHSTDTTQESWEYVEVCFPNEVDEIKSEVNSHAEGWSVVYTLKAFSPKYLMHSGKQRLRDFLIRRFLS